jgi:hypothetical protein
MRHGCSNLSQDRVSVLFGSTESEALSVAFAIHLDDGGVMDQSIDGRRRCVTLRLRFNLLPQPGVSIIRAAPHVAEPTDVRLGCAPWKGGAFQWV